MKRIRSRLGAFVLALAAVASASAQQPGSVAVKAETADARSLTALERPAQLRVADMPLEQALSQLYKSSGVPVSFSPSRIPGDLRVSCGCETASVKQALDHLLRQTLFRYREMEGHILVFDPLPNPETRDLTPRIRYAALDRPVEVLSAVPQRSVVGTIAGRVVSAATQQPLSGASVGVEGTTFGTVTGADGRFTVPGVPAGTHRVRVSHVGYMEQVKPVTVTTGATATLNVALAAQAVALEGIVAVGYGTQQKRDITGAIGSVSLEELEKVQVPTIAQALQGRVAGVQVTQNSAAPGGSVSIRIRGSGSISTTNEPLYVIDGVPISGGDNNDPLAGGWRSSPNPLASLAPGDIASIEVLKDASSTAIYGARGTNGVVLITTKKGTAGVSRMEFSSSLATQSVAKRYDMLNAQEYAQFANDYVRIDRGEDVPAPFPDPAAVGQGVDWQDVIFQDAPMMEHQVGISGGTDQTRFSMSGNYTDQQGVVRSSEFQRYSLRANVEHNAKSWLRVGTNLNVSRVHNSLGYTDGGVRGSQAGAVSTALFYLPLVPIYNPDGSYTKMDDNVPPELARFGYRGDGYDNPLAIINEITDQGENDRILGNLFAEFDLLEGMMLRVNGGANLVNSTRNEYYSSQTVRGKPPTNGVAQLGVVEQSHYLGEAILNYKRDFGDLHRLDFTTGVTAEQEEWFGRNTVNRNFPNDIGRFYDIGAGAFAAGPDADSNFNDWTLLSYLGRVNYSLADKYLFTLTGRADGSSKFGVDNKWGYFPSAAFAWRASEEPFLRDLGFLSDLKLRVSYGITGNQEIGSYRSLSQLRMDNYTFAGRVASGYRPVSIANPGLRWEKSEQFDAGFDAAFLSNRFTVTFDVYNKITDDLLLDVPLPYETGFTSALQNMGSVRNRGIELALGVDVLEGYGSGLAGLGWRTAFNVSANRSKVLDLGGSDGFQAGGIAGGVGLNGLVVRVGEPMGVFWGYKVDGLFRSQAEVDAHTGPDGKPIQPRAVPGQIRFVDTNGDGKISAADRTILGNPEPDFSLGWTNDLTFGAFNLYAFLQGTYGNDIFNVELMELSRSFLIHNRYAPSYLDAWSPQNPNGSWPVIHLKPGTGYTGPGTQRGDMSEQYLYDGSYLRLKNLTLSYNVPEQLTNRLAGMSSARIFLNGENLFTWTNYPGPNPDVNSRGQHTINRGIDFNTYPLARVYRLGVNFGL